MRALVFHSAENRLSIEDVPEPKIGQNHFAPEDVITENKFCGICGSDLRIWKGQMKVGGDSHLIFGHEFSAVVSEVGEAVGDFEVGNRVTCEEHVVSCGKCNICRTGNPYLCKTVESLPHTRHSPEGGVFCTFSPLPARFLHRVPENVSLEEAALIEPATVAAHAVVERAKVSTGKSVAVLGPGAIGLCAVQIAKASGATPVIATGLSVDEPVRLDLARRLGADAAVNVETEDLKSRVNELTDGLGVDAAIELAGSQEAVRQGLEILKPGGRMVIAGQGYPELRFDAIKSLIKREISMMGSLASTYFSFELVAKLMSEGNLNVKPMISATMPLEDWEKAFQLQNEGKAIRILLKP